MAEIKYTFTPESHFYENGRIRFSIGARHEFTTTECLVHIREENDYTASLDDFSCGPHQKGAGRRLLLYALSYIKAQYKDIVTITLRAVPHLPPVGYKAHGVLKADAQRKLNAYYTSLGFSCVDPIENDFTGSLDDIITQLKTM